MSDRERLHENADTLPGETGQPRILTHSEFAEVLANAPEDNEPVDDETVDRLLAAERRMLTWAVNADRGRNGA